MANYWDTFEPGLLAGEDYWEDFTPEAPTQTGVVGAVTGKRYQPWEKGYHNIAGLVDDSGQYDAWYDPDPPPETSVPDWGTPEGYENWKTRIGLETNNNNSNNNNSSTGQDGTEGYDPANDPSLTAEQRQAIIDAQTTGSSIDLKDLNWSKAILGFTMAGIPGGVYGLFSDQINTAMSGILDGSFFKDIFSGTDTEVAPATDTGQGDPMGGTIG
jgi:hypothetical protein